MLLPGLGYASPCSGLEKTYIQIVQLNPTKQMMTLICTGLGFLIGIVVGVVIQSENGPDREDFE
jgi:hypothetical protein